MKISIWWIDLGLYKFSEWIRVGTTLSYLHAKRMSTATKCVAYNGVIILLFRYTGPGLSGILGSGIEIPKYGYMESTDPVSKKLLLRVIF